MIYQKQHLLRWCDMEKKFKIGLVLSGGGAKGFAHLGLLKAMEERGLKPEIIAGASIGALVGALYADGYSATEMLEMFKNNRFFDLVQPKLNINSLLKTEKLQKKLKSVLQSTTFEELHIPLIVSTSNITNGKVVYFKSGLLIDKVLASISIPIVFNPTVIDGEYYVDGGLLDNFPVEQIRNDCEYVIGLHLHPFKKQDKIKTIRQNIERTFHIIYQSHGWEKAKYCNLYIEPEKLSDYSAFDVRKGTALFKIGYEKASEMLDKAAIKTV
ncbi:MAG: patatin-like phospholipase family protein [Bacteroidales bacterium]|jgi:NTE family protein|nr:patatin-like phospholipase family protein [Bacteroidales bacterium]